MSKIFGSPVLLIGGSGVVGTVAAEILSQLCPGLPIAIGGRNLAKAKSAAGGLPGATAIEVDLEKVGLGLPPEQEFGAIIAFAKDDWLNALAYAQDHGIPYVSVSGGTFEMAPEVGLYIRNPRAAPILLGSQWLAGAAAVPTLYFAKAFQEVTSIHLTALLDEQDMGGPAAYQDYERITQSAPFAMVRRNYDFYWAGGSEAKSSFADSSGMQVAANAYSPLDVVALGAATGAQSVRLDLAVAESPARRRGEHFSTEIGIEISGTREGVASTSKHRIIHPAGQAHLTGLFVALGIERLLGLAGGEPAQPGLYMPETLINPDHAVQALTRFGAEITTQS
jgi:hypothetical protein